MTRQRLQEFEAHRPQLVALAYRMLGDVARAEDRVQEAFLRFMGVDDHIASPKAYLVTIVTRLCLTDLGSARSRRELSRSDRLPEPVSLDSGSMANVERQEDVSMAFLVLLQRLTPAERAVLLLHDVFDFDHKEIAGLVNKSVPACRKMLERARRSVQEERRMLEVSQVEHRRLLAAFVRAASAGDVSALVDLLSDDAVLVTDGGPGGRNVGGLGNLPKPLTGTARIAGFIALGTTRNVRFLKVEERELNGQPGAVFWSDDQPFAALSLGVADGKIRRVFFHADLRRLGHLR